MDARNMRADCAHCAALCCVTFAFDRSQGFPMDKPNGVACSNLDCTNRCRIYARRVQKGFEACVHYDCLGAGQRVTQEVFAGRSWRDEPALLPDMIRAFITMRTIHELSVLLSTAAAGSLPSELRGTALRLLEDLAPVGGWTVEGLAAFERDGLARRIKLFLIGLRPHLQAQLVKKQAMAEG